MIIRNRVLKQRIRSGHPTQQDQGQILLIILDFQCFQVRDGFPDLSQVIFQPSSLYHAMEIQHLENLVLRFSRPNFGMVLLVANFKFACLWIYVSGIISGKRNTGFYWSTEALNLLGYAWRLWSENKALDLMDPILLESCKKFEVMKCINVGILFVQEEPDDRPTTSNVVFMLGGEATILPVPNQPAFIMRKPVSNTSSSSTKPGSISNELTMSVEEGR
ncbi:G-type lectin S-receptor-like serine/threonine-protein kinase At4g03230 [Olea europaea var. sylvestris]|uniref:G-type lectin S-receptor-like serine/threonine-protein kinase At4g03230 n=1 Tax=Olea europaea var. sylvestris TaxID=158386 RepID=UPI000C1D8057|nr:G-type lectin S-receptor-like serine/threonine-protein kinase At4g03230 [Olea europaea var. sylvestris]